MKLSLDEAHGIVAGGRAYTKEHFPLGSASTSATSQPTPTTPPWTVSLMAWSSWWPRT
jgi:hypothetical protein